MIFILEIVIYRTGAAAPLALPLGELATVRLTERVLQ